MAKRFYELRYEVDDRPAYIEDIGHLLKISGIVLQGKGKTIIVLSPTTTAGSFPMDKDNDLPLIEPSLEEWSEIIRASDDPEYFELDETGTIKAVHRKIQRAISGAVQQQIWVRDGLRCMFCGRAMGNVQLTVDHWIPLELGGKNDDSNYLSCCRRCNKEKGDLHPEKFCDIHTYDYRGLCLYLEGKAPASFIAHLV